MIRVKLPHGRRHARAARGLRRRHREVRAAQQGPRHDAPEHPAAPRPAAGRRQGDPRAVGRRPVQPRGLRQHGAQRHRRPVGRRRAGRALRPHPLRGGVRALLRAPPHDAAHAAQDQDRLRRLARGPRAERHPRHRLPRARARRRPRRRGPRRRRHVDHAARRPDALRVRRARRTATTSRSPRPCFRIFDRQDFLRVNRARARIKVLVDKIGIDALPRHGRGGAAGRLGRRARLRDRQQLLRARRGGRGAARPRVVRQSRTATSRSSSASSRPTSCPSARRASPPSRSRSRAATSRPSSCAASRTCAHVLRRLHPHDGAPEPRPALGARRGGLRRLEDPGRARPRRRRRRHDHRRRQLPGHRLVQARHHVVDGPQPGRAGAHRVDEHHRPADAAHPHQDERLPERLQPAPHRQHRVLRRVDQGRRAHDPGLRRAHRRQLRGRRDHLRHAPEGAPARQARPRGRRALAALVRGRAQRGRGLQRLRRARRHEGLRGPGARARACRPSSAWRR